MNKTQKPTLIILAAGMGSRYGKLKQMDAFGPNGETIIDYSIYDAIKAGFGKIVFIVRSFFHDEFKDKMDRKFGSSIQLEYVNQELDALPEGFHLPEGREKPWGTAHAVLVAKDLVHEPFAVINADDYYGVSSYQVLYDFLTSEKEDYAVVAYQLNNTLSDHGTVNRGVCYADDEGYLEKVVECTKISKDSQGNIVYPDPKSIKLERLSENTLVSMNMWAFQPSFFDYVEEQFIDFLKEHGNEEKSEFYIPSAVDHLIKNNILSVQVLHTDANWFGVTYQEDRPFVVEAINKLIAEEVYPDNIY